MKKVYLAAKFSRREEMEQLYAPSLPWIGMECSSRWVYGGEEGLTFPEIAALDLEDIRKCDALICFTHERGEANTNGRMFEAGYALALGKEVIFIGPFENVFMETPGVKVYPDWDSFITAA